MRACCFSIAAAAAAAAGATVDVSPSAAAAAAAGPAAAAEPAAQKELALESLVEFCQDSSLMHDLYVNYDCDMHVR